MGPILCRPTNGSSSCTGEFSLVGRGKEKTMSRRGVGMSHGGSSILLPSSLQAQKTSKSSRRRKVSLSYQDRNSDFNSPYGGNRWARRGHNWASPSVTTRRLRRRESSPTESVLGQPRVQKELDMDVIERAQRWFNGEEPEKEVDDSNWFDSIVDNSKLAVDPGTPVYDLEEDSGSTIENTKESVHEMSFSLFNFKKRVSNIQARPKDTSLKLQADFLVGAKQTLHVEAMKAVAVREHYVDKLANVLKRSRVEGVLYMGGPKFLFEAYLELFTNICKATCHTVETIDEWRYNIEQESKIKYARKEDVKLRRPAFKWNQKIVRGEVVRHNNIDYMDKMMVDLNRLLSQAVLPTKHGDVKEKQLIIEASKVSGDFLKGVPVSPLLLSVTLDDIVYKNAKPAKQAHQKKWEEDLERANREVEDVESEDEFSFLLQPRVFGSETWHEMDPNRIRKVASLLVEHREYTNTLGRVKESVGCSILSNAIAKKKDRHGASVVENKSLSGTAAQTMLLHEASSKLPEMRHMPKAESDQLISSLSAGISKSLSKLF